MSAEVVSLHGAPVAAPDLKPDDQLVGELERLLEAARAGELVGMAGVYLNKDKVVSYAYSGLIAGYGVLGGLDCLKTRLVRDLLSRE